VLYERNNVIATQYSGASVASPHLRDVTVHKRII